MKANQIYIIANGNQAPYGIGEIMEIIPESHFRKIHKVVSAHYNQPIMRRNSKDGQRVEFVFDQNDKLTGLELIG